GTWRSLRRALAAIRAALTVLNSPLKGFFEAVAIASIASRRPSHSGYRAVAHLDAKFATFAWYRSRSLGDSAPMTRECPLQLASEFCCRFAADAANVPMSIN